MTSRGGAGRGRVWRSVAGVAVAASLSIGGAQVVRADEPVVETAAPPVTAGPVIETAAPPVVESSVPDTVAVEVAAAVEVPVVAVGLPPVPPTTAVVAVVAVGLPPVPPTTVADDIDADMDASEVGGALSATLVAAALEGWQRA